MQYDLCEALTNSTVVLLPLQALSSDNRNRASIINDITFGPKTIILHITLPSLCKVRKEQGEVCYCTRAAYIVDTKARRYTGEGGN